MDFSTFLIIFILIAFIPVISFIARYDENKEDTSHYYGKKKLPFSQSQNHKSKPSDLIHKSPKKKTTSTPSLSFIIKLNRLIKNRFKKKVSLFPSLSFKKNFNDLLNKLKLEKHALELVNIHYRKHEIPKKTGGVRVLHIPSRSLKKIQKKILLNLLYKEKVHPCSYAYRKGKSIVDNARVHCGKAVIIKMDIRDFFPSVKADKIHNLFLKLGWNKEVADKLTELCTWDNGLPQGAPTSPALSNIILYELDKKLFSMARGFKASYSRYADDLTFSLVEDKPEIVRSIIKLTQLAVEKEGFRINFKKGKMNVLRNHQHQRICGITVNSDKPTLSRKERRKLRAIKHHLDNGRPATMSESQLEGWNNYKKMVHAEKTT
ncbi:MAG: retron St85 family RNA-directed DNA polymerase [Lentisphaeraceae bacterium]|nr:retron St85 family RNA-directed DNA polymerase [Lentisphaeraceae bacterium]